MLRRLSVLVAETKSLTRNNLGEEGPVLTHSLKEDSHDGREGIEAGAGSWSLYLYSGSG